MTRPPVARSAWMGRAHPENAAGMNRCAAAWFDSTAGGRGKGEKGAPGKGGPLDKKQWYEFWRDNCRWCSKDGRCQEQNKRKQGDGKARCAEFEDKSEKETDK